MSQQLKRILFVPDVHRPYHDERAWALMLKAAKRFKPHTIVVLGDFADFYAVSAHEKDPRRTRDLMVEVEDVRQGLRQLEALDADHLYFVQGNHENRLERYLASKAPELFGVVSVPKVLQLDRWKYTQYKDHLKLGKLYITHDVDYAGKYSLQQSQAAYEANLVIGHTHRMGYMVAGNVRGKPHVAAMFGWLGDANQADYMHKAKAARDWALGFGIGFMEPNGHVHLQPVPIVNYRCVVEGTLVE